MEQKDQQNPEQFIPLAEAARQTGYHQDYLGLLCRQGEIKATKVANNWLITAQELDKFVASRKKNEFVSLATASKETGYHQDYLGFLCRTGKLKGFKIGRNWVTTKTDLDNFLKSYKNGINEVTDETGNKIPVHVESEKSDVSEKSENQNQGVARPFMGNPGQTTFAESINEVPADEADKSAHYAPPPDLSHLKTQVLENIESRIKGLDSNLALLENKLEETRASQTAAASPASSILPVVAAAAIGENPRQELQGKFASNLEVANVSADADKSARYTPENLAGYNFTKDKIAKLYNSFARPVPSNLPAVLAASVIAVAGLAGAIFYFNSLGQPASQPEVAYLNKRTAISNQQSAPTSSAPTIINRGGDTNIINQVLGLNQSQVYGLINDRLNQYLAEGKFLGPQGPAGAQGEQGPQGTAGASGIPGGANPFAAYQPNPATGFTGGTGFSTTQFSSDSADINSLQVSNLTVSDNSVFNGNTDLNGSTTLANLDLSSITGSTQCLHVDSNGNVTGTGADCGAGGGGSGNSAFTLGNGFIFNATSTDLIGIGTVTPTTTLFVQGKGGTNPFEVASSTGGELLTVTQSGNFGLGTGTPAQTLSVVGNMSLTGALFDSTNASGTLGMVLQTTGIGTQWVATSTLGLSAALTGGSNGYLARWVSSSQLATSTLLDNGTVAGVNATSSGVSFNLQGAASLDPFQITSSTGATLAIFKANGSVGIGTSSPLATLYVQGTSTSPAINIFTLASSSGVSFFTVNPAGSTTLSSLGTGLVRSVGGELNTGPVVLGSGDVSGTLGVGNGGTGTTTAGSAGTVAYYDGSTLRSTLGGAYYQILRSSGSGAPAFDDIKNLLSQGTGISLSGTSTISIASGVINNVSTGTIGTNFNIATTTNSLVINLPNASVVNSGQLLSGDWAVFNNKLSGSLTANQIVYAAGASTTQSSASFLWDNTAKALTVNSSTPAGASLLVVASSSGQTLPIFAVASTSGSSIFQVTARGNVVIGTTTASQMLLTDPQNNLESLAMGGDATLSYTTGNLTLATVNSNVGTFGSSGQLVQATANAKGLITAIANVIPSISTTSSGSLFYLATSTTNLFSLNVPINLVNNVSTGTLGTNFNISTSTNGSSNSLVINLPNASVVNSGQLLSGDWAVFNNKLGAVLGANGYAVRFTGATTTATSTLIDNGVVTGINASSSLTSFLVQGTTTLNPFQITSSTGITLAVVKANGSFGIGTSTPQYTLSVQGTSTLPALDLFDIASSSGSSYFHVTNSGNVGVGTTTPVAKFSLQGTAGANDILDLASSTSTSVLRVTAAGYVGIGTATPTSLLHVVSTDASSSTVINLLTLGHISTASTTVSGNGFNPDTGNSLTTNLVSYWKMDEASGNLVDSVDGNTGTANGTSVVAGKVNNGRSFNGTSDYVSVANAANIDITSRPFSVSIWFFPTDNATAHAILRKGDTNTTTQYDMYMYDNTNSDDMRFMIQGTDGFNYGACATNGTVTLNTWHHAVGVWKANGDVSLYLDNVEYTSTACGGEDHGRNYTGTIHGGQTLRIGALNSTPGAFFKGTIDEMGIWSKALSSTEINDLYNSGNANAYGSGGTTTTTNNVGANGIGTGLLFQATNSSGTPVNTGRITSLLTTAASGSETSAITFETRNNGAALAERMRITGAGLVGIGTTTPGAMLALQGSGANNLLDISSSTGISVLRVTANQRVGIGSTTPNATLTVEGTSTSPTLDVFQVASSTNSVLFDVLANGNVGIGTTTPARTLTVAGDIRATGILYDSTNAAGTSGNFLMTTGTGYQWTATSTLFGSTPETGSGTNGQVAYFTAANTLASANSLLNNGTVVGVNASSSTVSFNVQGTTNLDPFRITSSTGVTLAVVKANGSVGIGTSTPLTTLSIEGTSTLPVLDLFDISSSTGSSYFHVMNNGNVGIGSSTPAYLLDVNGTFHVNIITTSTSTGVDGTGGTITHAGGYTIHTFTGSGTFTPPVGTSVDYLVVAGGGGGSDSGGGGGGAGGVATGTVSVTVQAYTVTVGGGGAGSSGGSLNGTNGSNSVFGSIATAIGGGGGGGYGSPNGQTGSSGGSGGGGGAAENGTPGNGGAGTAGQGNNGGKGIDRVSGSTNAYPAGGGGGAGAVGADAASGQGGNGGAGVSSSISGSAVTYGGGGGGSGNLISGTSAGSGGNGGGGRGGDSSNNAGTNGTANTGGGGGGARSGAGGSGGSGIVIIRYLTASAGATVLHSSDSLVVASTGNVGVGTTTPIAALQVTGQAINQDGSSSSATTTRALYVYPNPTNAANTLQAADFRAFEVAPYTWVLASTTAITNAYSSLFNAPTVNTTTVTTLANAQTVTISGAPLSTSNLTITSSSAFTILAGAVSTTTNAYSMFINAPTGATNNYAAVFTGGNVGIGSTSPNTTLAIQGRAGSSDLFDLSSSTGISILRVTANQRVGIGSTTPNATLVVEGTSTSPTLDVFRAASSTGAVLFDVLANGNVGINTTTPGRTLSVAGDIRATGILYDSTNSAGTAGNFLMTTGTGYQWTATSTLFGSTPEAGSGTNGQVAYFTAANTLASANSLLNNGTVVGVNATSSTVSFNIKGTTTLDPFQITSSTGITLAVVKANGSVGIGTSTPTVTLSVQGTSTLPGLDLFNIASSSGASYFHVTNNGNIGIGTTTPVAELALQGTGSDILDLANSNGVSVLRVASGGNVGIGTTTPGTMLHVVATDLSSSTVTNLLTLGHMGTTPVITSGHFSPDTGSSLSTGLVSYYKMDEASGNLIDAVGGTNPGVVTGTTVVAGKINNGRSFNGSSDFVTLSNPSNFNFSSTVSLSAWIKNNSTSSRMVMGKGAGSNDGYYMDIDGFTSGNVECGYISSSGNYRFEGSAVSTGVWTHVVCVFDSTQGTVANRVRLYINGSEIGSPTVSSQGTVTSIGTNASNVLIGKTQGGSFYNGVVDEVGIWSKALSAQEVTDLYNSGNGNTDSGSISNVNVGANGIGTGLLFQADNSSGTPVNSGRITSLLTNAATGSETSALTFETRTGGAALQEAMRITGAGLVGIGTTSPTQLLTVGSSSTGGNELVSNGWLCVTTGDQCSGIGSPAAGTVYAVGSYTTGADVAENYPTDDVLEPGDVVMMDMDHPIYIKKATPNQSPSDGSGTGQASASAILGVVSTQPGVLLNGYKAQTFVDASTVPVALAGRVPVKVSNENGNINIGDYLTLSKTLPGYAMKATVSGEVIGQALESFTATDTQIGADGADTATGTVLVFMKVGYQNINNTFVLGPDDGQLTSATSTQAEGLHYGGEAFLIDQKGSGNILQLQNNEQDRFLVASSGAVSILANICTQNGIAPRGLPAGSNCGNVLSVSNGSTTLFSINSVGDAQFTGHIIVGQDTAGTAVIKAGDNQATVSFNIPYNSVPKVIVTPDMPVVFAVATKTPTGFTIIINQPAAEDISFDWFVIEQPADTASVSSVNLSVITSPSPPNQSPSDGSPNQSSDSGTGQAGSGQAAPSPSPGPSPSPTPDLSPPPAGGSDDSASSTPDSLNQSSDSGSGQAGSGQVLGDSTSTPDSSGADASSTPPVVSDGGGSSSAAPDATP